MKTLVTLVAALLAAGAIILFGVLSWAADNWLTGMITGLAAAQYPAWLREGRRPSC